MEQTGQNAQKLHSRQAAHIWNQKEEIEILLSYSKNSEEVLQEKFKWKQHDILYSLLMT